MRALGSLLLWIPAAVCPAQTDKEWESIHPSSTPLRILFRGRVRLSVPQLCKHRSLNPRKVCIDEAERARLKQTLEAFAKTFDRTSAKSRRKFSKQAYEQIQTGAKKPIDLGGAPSPTPRDLYRARSDLENAIEYCELRLLVARQKPADKQNKNLIDDLLRRKAGLGSATARNHWPTVWARSLPGKTFTVDGQIYKFEYAAAWARQEGLSHAQWLNYASVWFQRHGCLSRKQRVR